MIKILLCCFNEAQSLKKLLGDIEREMQLVKRDFEVMFCLDGTTDNSIAVINEFASRIKIKILPQINQRGLGIAYKRLFLEIVKNSAEEDLVITLDADNTHNPNQISEMLEHFKKNSLDVLIASRFCGNSVMDDFPFYRKIISKSTSLLLQTFFTAKRISGKNIIDYTSGYRIYRAKKIKELFGKEKNEFITEPEFTYTCEFLIKLSRLKSRLDEIAISYDYGNKIGKSKLRIMRNLWRLIVMLLKLKFKKP